MFPKMGVLPKMIGLAKSQRKMDDLGVPPHFRKPPYEVNFIYNILVSHFLASFFLGVATVFLPGAGRSWR